MKKLGILLGLLLAAGLMVSCGGDEHYALTYHVAPGGDDANPGTKRRPFATLERARDEIRLLKTTEGLPQGGIRVLLADGTYRRTGTFTLTAEDSGSEACPIVYGGGSKESVVFLGGALLSGWEPATGAGMGARIEPRLRDSIFQIDLKKAGITDLGAVTAPYDSTLRADLFCDGQYMALARWPNEGEWALIKDVPMFGPNRYHYDLVTHYGRFVYDNDRPSRWKDQSDLWAQGFWVYDWANETKRIDRIDTLIHEIFPELPHHHYGYRTGQRYFYLNIPEELDAPGEFYVDRTSGMLYFYPPGDIAASRIVFPDLRVPMISLDEASHVTVERITFEGSRHGGIIITGGTANRVAGCEFFNLGQWSVEILGGTDNGILSCDFHDIARSAIHVTGGDRTTLTPCGHFIENCDIHHNGRVFRSHNPAIEMDGVGIRVAHCKLHHTAHTGLFYYGNDHLFEYNEFSHIGMLTGDVGCINTGFDWTFLGHVVRYNYFHDIHSPGHLGCFTIYPDLPCGGIHLHGNIFYEVDWVFNTNSGRGMLIENNLMLSSRGISYKVWPRREKFALGGSWQMIERLAAVPYDGPLYLSRYPVLKGLVEDLKTADSTLRPGVMDIQLCKDNLVRNNIATGPVFLRFIGEVDLKQVRTEGNLICTEVAYSHSPISLWDDFDSYTDNDPAVIKQLEEAGNILRPGQDPGIADPARGDFSFVSGSPAAGMSSFEPIPFEQIGLKADKYRKSVR